MADTTDIFGIKGKEKAKAQKTASDFAKTFGKSDILSALSKVGGAFGGSIDNLLGLIGKGYAQGLSGTGSPSLSTKTLDQSQAGASKTTKQKTGALAAAVAAKQAQIASNKSAVRRSQQDAATKASKAASTPAANPAVTDKAATYTPSSSGTSAVSSSGGSVTKAYRPAATDTTATDATATTDPMASIYGPLEQVLKNNKLALENRYGQNAADIKSITGVLTAVAPIDQAKIKEQFAQSLQQQQQQTAAAIAGTRLENAAGVQGASAAASELGSGDMPVPTSSATGTAQQQQIDNAAQGQSNWSALMGAMQNQQLANADAAQRGYGFEIANALQQLARQKNTELGALENQGLTLESQKAQSQLSAQQAANQLASDMAIAEARNQNALDVAGINAGAKTSAAATSAGARRYAADLAAATKTANPATYSNDVGGWMQKMAAAKATPAQINSLMSQAQKAYNAAKAEAVQGKTPSPGAVYSQWVKLYGNQTFAAPMQEYISKYLPR